MKCECSYEKQGLSDGAVGSVGLEVDSGKAVEVGDEAIQEADGGRSG